jgi:rod shape determining protein RodA
MSAAPTALARIERGARRWWARLASRPTLDPVLTVALALLAAAGLVVLHGASGGNADLVAAQGFRLAVGFGAMYLLARLPPAWLRSLTPWLYAGSLVLLLLVPFFGTGRSARSWLDLGFFHLQPAELAKLTLPLALAWVLHARLLPPSFGALVACAMITALPIGLIAIQPDFGTAALVLASAAFVVFLAGMRWWQIGALVLSACLATPLLWHFYLVDYQKARILTFLDPHSDPLGSGWNIIQAEIAIGSGGLFGKGWGASTQAQLDFLPEHTTDFIFAVLAEEFGLVGVLVVLLIYAVIVGRSIHLATLARDTWGRLVAGSLALTFVVYVLVNGGMVAGLLPVVGVPMPLLSYGGTSAVTLLAGFGILMSIHAHRRSD